MVAQISSKANSDEINGAGTHAIAAISKSNSQDELILHLFGELQKSNNELTLAQNKKSGSDFTPLVQLLETRRDYGLKSFFKTIDGATYRLDEEVAKAAKKIKKVIKRHGSTMYSLPQDQQTAKMASLFQELSLPDMVAAIDLTGTTVHVRNQGSQP